MFRKSIISKLVKLLMNTQEGFSKVMIGQQGKCKSNYEMFTTAVFVFTHLPEARLQIKLDSDK